MAQRDVLIQRTNLLAILISLLAIAVGVLLLTTAAQSETLQKYQGWQTLLRQFGSLLIASVGVAFLWGLIGRRAFLEEILARVKLSHEVTDSGVIGIPTDYEKGVDWEKLFRNSSKVDVFFAYGRTWRRNHSAELLQLANRRARVRVILPDPESSPLMMELAGRFSISHEEIVSRIREAETNFRHVFPPNAIADFSLFYFSGSPVFAVYRFDNTILWTMYNHRTGPVPVRVPAFVIESGTLYEFFRQELQAILEDKDRTRVAYMNRGN